MDIKIEFTMINKGEFEGILGYVKSSEGKDFTKSFNRYCKENNIVLKTLEDVHSALESFGDKHIFN